jgi:hypothetical protein
LLLFAHAAIGRASDSNAIQRTFRIRNLLGFL